MMCAKILSQYAYLQYYQNMCDSLEITLPRGFNILANDAGYLLVKKIWTRYFRKSIKD